MRRCVDCGRAAYQDGLASCPSCDGVLAEIPKVEKIRRQEFHSRRMFCVRCEHFGNHQRGGVVREGCGQMERPCDVERAWLAADDAWCPIGRHAELSPPKKKYAPPPVLYDTGPSAMDLDYIRDTIGGSRVVVTAGDARFERGIYMLAWTLLRACEVRLVVYDMGMDATSKTYGLLRDMGADIRRFEPEFVGVDGWQTFHKPMMIRDAMADHDEVLWIDSDIAVTRSVLPAFSAISDGVFVPDHGVYVPERNRNTPAAMEAIGQRRKHWGSRGNDWPCCGVLGLQSDRDAGLVDKWVSVIRSLASRELLRLPAFYDQGVFQELYDGELADGYVWNNLQVPRVGTVADVLRSVYSARSAIAHFGGAIKPWFGWGSIDWGDPRDARDHASVLCRSA